MGSDSGFSDMQPVHTVYLDAYWIDQTEVTNGMYAKCVQAGICEPPSNTSDNRFSRTEEGYYGTARYFVYPVIYVNWNSAVAYCKWAGARLPTEAEWEKAARGTDGRLYPWGNGISSNNLLNYYYTYGDGTTAVGSYPSGASPYGAQDMAGNVAEWVNDWYSETYYNGSPASNPQGPSSGNFRVIRGGSFTSGWDSYVTTTDRDYKVPGTSDFAIGFRCARKAQP
jgi:eukaryotic-like serine/threonine-protein kinase